MNKTSMWITRILAAIFLLSGLAFLIIADRDLGGLIDPISLAVVLPPVMAVMICCQLTRAEHWSRVLLALGVPFGLLGSMFGVVGITANAFDPRAIYPSSAIMFLTILYGGVVSAVGYFALPNEKEVKGSLPVPLMFFCVISFLGLMLWTANVSSGLAQIYSPLALSVFLMTFGWTIVFKRQIGLQELAETSLFSSILTLVVGIILWLESGIRELSDVSVALNGLLYGLGIYICIYIVSLSYRDLGEINASRANWHWMEITAFLIFLLFAPETIREVLLEQPPS